MTGGQRTHYDTLGVSRGASPTEIRKAYRALARRHHPDTRGGQASLEMTVINAAWHVLSDPGRRAVYDASLARPGAAPPSAEGTRSAHRSADASPVRPSLDPARFPWRGVAIFILVGSVGVVVLSLFAQPGQPPPVDNLLTPGSCVTIEPGQVAREVACSGPHDAVVRQLVPFDSRCPSDSATLRDRQGMGWACVDAVGGA